MLRAATTRQADETRPRTAGDEVLPGAPELLSGWARSPTALSHVVEARDDADLDELFEHPPRRGTIARGAGHSLGDAAQRAGGVAVRATALNRMLRFDSQAGEAAVEAGISLGDLMRAVVPHGWLPAVRPGTRFVTVGGAIAADVHGRNQHADGSFASHVTAIRLRTPTEAVTVGPDQMPDLFWATAGGMGLTGVILDATLRLTRIETAWIRARTERAANLDDVMALLAADEAYRYSAAWIDCLAGRKGPRTRRRRARRSRDARRSPAARRQRPDGLRSRAAAPRSGLVRVIGRAPRRASGQRGRLSQGARIRT